MYQPQILEIDPQRIKFNKLNPRKHGGEEYQGLKQSIQEIGIVQPPLVRHLTGIFYEVIDGEGRVSVAQDLQMPAIKVINIGDVNDDEALEKLVVSNAVRQFDFFARCRGMAAMHRKGKTAEQIGKELGVPYPGMVIRDMAIGYFPEDIHTLMLMSISKDESMAQVWSNHRMLYELQPLRQVLPGKDPKNNGTLDGVYDYSEVKRAVEQVIAGKISTSVEMRAYVAERRRELFEAQFGKELQERLEAEIASTKQALEEAKILEVDLKVNEAKEEVAQYYRIQLETLQAQKDEVEKRYNSALAKALKGEQAATLEAELEVERKKTEVARRRMRDEMNERLLEEEEKRRKRQELALKEMQEQITKDLQEQKAALDQERHQERIRQEIEQAQARRDLEAYYKEQDAKRKLKAETSYRQLVASTSEHLSQSQQSILTLISEGMIRGVEWLSQEELGSLLFAMRAARNTLEEAEQSIQERMGVIESSETSIDEHTSERSLVNHG